MTKSAAQSLNEYAEIRYLTPGVCTFTRTSGGFLSLKIGDESYPRVGISRAFPFTYPNKYLSVRDKDMKEIGIIEELDGFSKETVDMVLEELERRYFTPSITGIKTLKEEFGYSYWEVETDRGDRRFTVKGNESIIPLDSGRILILDVDGNRFEIEDCNNLDPKSFKLIDAFI